MRNITVNPKAVAKFITAATAGLGVAAIAVTDGVISTSEWLQIAVAVLGAVGVYVVPNKQVAE